MNLTITEWDIKIIVAVLPSLVIGGCISLKDPIILLMFFIVFILMSGGFIITQLSQENRELKRRNKELKEELRRLGYGDKEI